MVKINVLDSFVYMLHGFVPPLYTVGILGATGQSSNCYSKLEMDTIEVVKRARPLKRPQVVKGIANIGLTSMKNRPVTYVTILHSKSLKKCHKNFENRLTNKNLMQENIF